ncbi:MAG TPA: tetratricopeptide repeat protein, partial [Pyrinomonadaceae bacterium]|nr:tetratricopeptide repeat protein [Pyrinomonadaceae bacterium]
MEDKLLARKHFDKAFDYYFKGSRKAIKAARAAIAHNPKWSRPHWLLGQVFMFVPPIDLESAIREYREVTRKEPQWSKGHHDLGRALAKQGRIDEAMIAFRESLRLEPDLTWTRIWLAKCLLKR